MKKIIAVLLSINLLVLNASPVLAEIVPTKQAAQKLAKGLIKKPSVKLPENLAKGLRPVTPVSSSAIRQAALNGMHLPLMQESVSLPNSNPLLPPARQILAHNNAKERAQMLRSKFVKLALKNEASPKDIQTATDFYRNNLKAEQKVLFEGMVLPATGTVADIASLGLLGNKQDAQLIFETARKAQETGQEAIVTAAAARALLRLEAYPELMKLSVSSNVQPELWNGIAQYAQDHNLPLRLRDIIRMDVDVKPVQRELEPLGLLNQIAVDPSEEATYLYMNAGRTPALNPVLTQVAPQKPTAAKPETPAEAATLEAPIQLAPVTATPTVAKDLVVAPTQTAALTMADEAAIRVAQTKANLLAKTKEWLARFKPTSEDDTKFAQRAALYLTAFSIGLEIGTPIMASVKTALSLPLSLAVWVTVATYSPYLFGSFLANWLKTKIGRKGTVNTGLALMGGSFALGASALGLDGSFTAWNDQILQFYNILAALTVASTGSVFIHNAVGPVMTEISHKANDLVRQKRGTYIELSRSMGMLASFAFPFIATSMLGLDWSAPFILALPFVGASALFLNWARLPNTKPQTKTAPAELKVAQSPVMDATRKPRKAMSWKDSILNNSYVRLLREEPGVGSFISGLFIMNAVEMGINSGFLFMMPQLTANESDRYLLGMFQFAVPFLVGRYMAAHFLKWFPKRNISVATLLASTSALASLFMTGNVYALTAALATSELGISAAFTLAFARTARNHATQDRVTSLIMATAVSCAVGPLLLTQVATALMSAGMMGEAQATMAALVAIPSVLGLMCAALFRRMENKTVAGLKVATQRMMVKARKLFKKK